MVGLAFLYLPGCACDGPVISVLDLLVLVRRVGPHKLGICWVLRAETGFLELTPFRSPSERRGRRPGPGSGWRCSSYADGTRDAEERAIDPWFKEAWRAGRIELATVAIVGMALGGFQ